MEIPEEFSHLREQFDFERMPNGLIATILGIKPAFLIVDVGEGYDINIDKLRAFGLECTTHDNVDLGYGYSTGYTIAQNKLAAELLTSDILTKFISELPGLEERLISLFLQVKDLSIAKALSFLGQIPTFDHEYRSKKPTTERPEVAIFNGILLGYPMNDISYYVRTRCLGEPREEYDPEKPMSSEDEYPYVYYIKTPNQP